VHFVTKFLSLLLKHCGKLKPCVVILFAITFTNISIIKISNKQEPQPKGWALLFSDFYDS
jgi:hypothetical protein